MLAVATEFKLNSWRRYFSFSRYTYNALKQIRKSGGIVHVKIRPFRLMTLTVWKNRKDMLAFRNSGAHLAAMKKSNYFGAIKSTSWETDTIPTWLDAMEKLSEASI